MTNMRGKSRVGFRPALTLLEDRLVPAGRPLPFPVIAAGTDAGVPAQVPCVYWRAKSASLDVILVSSKATAIMMGDLSRPTSFQASPFRRLPCID
jgi:hypothetical protein